MIKKGLNLSPESRADKTVEGEQNVRRNLVLTDETARHWFRRSLPPHIKADLIPIPAESLWRLTTADVRGFASVYLAATAAVFAFII
jgi:hypothetical protein